MVTDKEKIFSFRSYAFVPTGIHHVQIFEEVTLEVILVPRPSISAKAQFFLGIIAPLSFRSSWSLERG